MNKRAAISVPTIFLTMSSVVIFSLIALILYQSMGNFNIVLSYTQSRSISLLLTDRLINSADCLAYESLSYAYSPMEDKVIEYRRIYPGIIDARKLLIGENIASGVPTNLSNILEDYDGETDEELLNKLKGGGFIFTSLNHPYNEKGEERTLNYCPYAMERKSFGTNYYCKYTKNGISYEFSDWIMLYLGKGNDINSITLTMSNEGGKSTSFYVFLSLNGIDWEVVEVTGTGKYDFDSKNYRYAIVALKKPDNSEDSYEDTYYKLSGLSFGGIGNTYDIARNFPINIGFECANMFINKEILLKQAVEEYEDQTKCEEKGYSWDNIIGYCYEEKNMPYKAEILFEIQLFDAQTNQRWLYNNGVCGDDENDYCLPFEVHYPVKIRFANGVEHYGDLYLTSYFNYNPENYNPYEQT